MFSFTADSASRNVSLYAVTPFVIWSLTMHCAFIANQSMLAAVAMPDDVPVDAVERSAVAAAISMLDSAALR
jgi:uncharacterized membrane protein